MLLALCVQIPPIFFFIPEISGIAGCQGSLWLAINAVLAIVNVIAAFYLAFKVVDTNDPNMEHLDTSMKRVTYLLCHDCFMAIYICFFIAFFICQAVGATWVFTGDYDEDPDCSSTVTSNMRIANALGWFYIFGGFFAIMFSMCCATFDTARYQYQGQQQQQQQQQNNNNAAQANVETPTPPYQANTGYSAQGVPSNDFPAARTASNTTYNAQGIPSDDFPQKHSAAPTQEPDIPVAYAEALPQHHASAPPEEYDVPMGDQKQAGRSDPEPSAGSNVGGAAGKQLGKLFSSDQEKQQKIEESGKTAGAAVEKGFLSAKKFVASKLAKK